MNNMLLRSDLTAEELAMVQMEVNSKKKSAGVAYALWFFLGGFGGHRYYLGNIGMGIAMTLTLGGLGIWAFIDVFFIGRRMKKINDELEANAIMQVKAMRKQAQ